MILLYKYTVYIFSSFGIALFVRTGLSFSNETSKKNALLFAVYRKTATFAAEITKQKDENIRKYILVVALFTTHKVVRDEGRMYNRDKIKRSVALAADLFFFR